MRMKALKTSITICLAVAAAAGLFTSKGWAYLYSNPINNCEILVFNGDRIVNTRQLFWGANETNRMLRDCSNLVPSVWKYVNEALGQRSVSEPDMRWVAANRMPTRIEVTSIKYIPLLAAGLNHSSFVRDSQEDDQSFLQSRSFLNPASGWDAGWGSSRYDELFQATGEYSYYVPESPFFRLLILGAAVSMMLLIRRYYRRFARFTDVVISIMALGFSFPLMVMLAVLVKIDSRGPVFFLQKRVGYNRRRKRRGEADIDRRGVNCLGKPFVMYKFRTMRADAESKGAVWARANDDRVTRMGKILRKLRLDELPQFFNVLKGDMSVIGPRPERPEFTTELNNNIVYYYRRFNVNPGITGLAQIRYRYTANVKDTRKKLKYDLLYTKRRYMALDARILMDTFLFFAKGAR
jgi:lipopolysaccharide/colanic/teichoic acid biosynthesis glycosyltransferase